MRFESGMLGFLVIVLAVGLAIPGTILLSAEESTESVTKYRPMTDITGLFNTEERPQFFYYDLSKNYTGYYTERTVFNGTNYWGGATFSRSTLTVNNYPVQYVPIADTNAVEDLRNSGISNTNPPGANSFIIYYLSLNEDLTYGTQYGTFGNCISLSDFLSNYSISAYDYVTVVPTTSGIENWIFFGSISDMVESSDPNVYGVYYVDGRYDGDYPNQNWHRAAISMKYIKSTNRVNLYYGETPVTSTFVRSLPLSDCVIMFGNGNNSIPTAYPLDGHSATLHAWNDIQTEYMDISKGVRITGY